MDCRCEAVKKNVRSECTGSLRPLPRVRGTAFDWAAGKLIEWPPPSRAQGGPDFSVFNNFHHREANRGHRHSDGEWHTRRLRLRGRRDSTHGRHCNAPQPAPGGASVSAKPHRPKEDSRDMDTWDQSPNSPPPKRRPSPTHPQCTDRPRSRNPRPHRRHPARLRPIGQGRSHSLELLERGSRSVPGDGPCRVPFTSDRSTSAGECETACRRPRPKPSHRRNLLRRTCRLTSVAGAPDMGAIGDQVSGLCEIPENAAGERALLSVGRLSRRGVKEWADGMLVKPAER